MDQDLSKFKLKRPCAHCPFRTDGNPIRFAALERAQEIEEQAYRSGFPCHETVECREDPLTGDEGFHFDEGGSYCIGYVIMRLKQDGDCDPWPAIDNDEDLLRAVAEHLGDWWNAPVFESEAAFFEANKGRFDGDDPR